MKKLLLISPVPPPYSGMERATQLLLECRVAKAFEVLLVDSGSKSRDNNARGRASVGKIMLLAALVLRILFLSIFRRPNVALTPLAQNRVGFAKCGLIILAAAVSGVPVVTWMGGSAFGEFYHRESGLFQWYIRLCLKNVAHIIVRGRNQFGQFDGLFPRERMSVVYNPRLAAAPFKPSRKEKPLRILYMSLVSKAKGAMDALEAVGLLRRQGVDVSLTLAGDLVEVEKNIMHVDSPDSTSGAVKEIMHRYGLHDVVDMPGFLGGKDKQRAFEEHDVFLFPSYSEGAPFSVLEAVANGLPIVATPVGNLPELLDGETDILYCGIGDPESIARQIRRLADSPELMETLPVNADRRLEERCSSKDFEEKMIALLTRAAR